MGAPAEATGGIRNAATAEASGRKTRGSGRSATTSVKLCPDTGHKLDLDNREGKIQGAERLNPEAGAGSVPRDTKSDDGAPLSRRAEAIRAKTPVKRGRAKPRLRRYDTTTSSRPRIIAVAREKASELGYERLKLSDLTAATEISHQGFYIHFKNKRHAVAVATSEQLGAVAELIISSSKDEAWAKRLEDEIDRALAEAYPAPDGPESLLRRKFVELVEASSFNRTRIEELVKASTLGHGEFYRRYGGKKGSLQRIYGQTLIELREEVGSVRGSQPLIALSDSLAGDLGRAKLLLLGASYLPTGPEPEPGVATQESFPALIDEIMRDSTAIITDAQLGSVRGAALELIRSALLEGRLRSLPEHLAAVSAMAFGVVGDEDALADALAA